jgi:hypothetical protein
MPHFTSVEDSGPLGRVVESLKKRLSLRNPASPVEAFVRCVTRLFPETAANATSRTGIAERLSSAR